MRKIQEQKFRSLIEAAPDALVIVNDSGNIDLVNNVAEKLFGYSREELIGKPIELLIPQRFIPKHKEQRTLFAENLLISITSSGMELCGIRKDGSEFPVEIRIIRSITIPSIIIPHKSFFILEQPNNNKQ